MRNTRSNMRSMGHHMRNTHRHVRNMSRNMRNMQRNVRNMWRTMTCAQHTQHAQRAGGIPEFRETPPNSAELPEIRAEMSTYVVRGLLYGLPCA